MGEGRESRMWYQKPVMLGPVATHEVRRPLLCAPNENPRTRPVQRVGLSNNHFHFRSSFLMSGTTKNDLMTWLGSFGTNKKESGSAAAYVFKNIQDGDVLIGVTRAMEVDAAVQFWLEQKSDQGKHPHSLLHPLLHGSGIPSGDSSLSLTNSWRHPNHSKELH